MNSGDTRRRASPRARLEESRFRDANRERPNARGAVGGGGTSARDAAPPDPLGASRDAAQAAGAARVDSARGQGHRPRRGEGADPPDRHDAPGAHPRCHRMPLRRGRRRAQGGRAKGTPPSPPVPVPRNARRFPINASVVRRPTFRLTWRVSPPACTISPVAGGPSSAGYHRRDAGRVFPPAPPPSGVRARASVQGSRFRGG